jgi:hypothetical protein
MFVIRVYHFVNSGTLMMARAHALELRIADTALLFLGAGRFSFDRRFGADLARPSSALPRLRCDRWLYRRICIGLRVHGRLLGRARRGRRIRAMLEAMQNGQQPAWVAFLNPVLGVIGVRIGQRTASRSAKTSA